MKLRFLAGLAAALLLLGTMGCGSKSAYGTVSGIVTGWESAGVYDAHVQARDSESGTVIKETFTDLMGRFKVSNLPAGKAVDLVVTKDGYAMNQATGMILMKGEFRVIEIPIHLSTNEGTVVIKGVITLE